jgi:glycine/D-amino acid oxidase-like deaminating enzyme
LDDYRRLEAELPGVQVRWSGSLNWGGHEPEPAQRLLADEHLIEAAQAQRLEPRLRTPPARALHKTGDGAVDPVAVTRALVEGARGHGAEVLAGTAVTALQRENGRVIGVATSHGPIPSRTVVVSAGADAPALCAPLGYALPVAPSPALLLRFAAPRGLVRTLIANADLEVREAKDGDLLVAAEYGGETGRAELIRSGRTMLDRLAATLSVDGDLHLVSVRVGMRPMPRDGLPIIGPVPGAGAAYLAVMHAGVTLAPVVGRLVASEVVLGTDAEELRLLRPARFDGPQEREGGD